MNRKFILIIASLTFILTACGGGSGVAGKDAVENEIDNGPRINVGSGCPEGNPLCNALAESPEDENSGDDRPAEVVKIRKGRAFDNDCTVGMAADQCSKTLIATGGRGKYVWEIKDPGGAEDWLLIGNRNRSGTAKLKNGRPLIASDARTYTIKVKVADYETPSNAKEEEFEIKIVPVSGGGGGSSNGDFVVEIIHPVVELVYVPDFRIEAYSYFVGPDGSEDMHPADLNSFSITDSMELVLIARKPNVQETLAYNWYINGRLMCKDEWNQNCVQNNGMDEDFKVFVPAEWARHHGTEMVYFRGKTGTYQNLRIEARGENSRGATVVIANLVINKFEINLATPLDAAFYETVGPIAFTITGGVGPYQVVRNSSASWCSDLIEFADTIEPRVVNNSLLVTGRVIVNHTRLSPFGGNRCTPAYDVTDARGIKKTVKGNIRVKEDMILRKEGFTQDYFYADLMLHMDDVKKDSTLTMIIYDKNNREIFKTTPYDIWDTDGEAHEVFMYTNFLQTYENLAELCSGPGVTVTRPDGRTERDRSTHLCFVVFEVGGSADANEVDILLHGGDWSGVLQAGNWCGMVERYRFIEELYSPEIDRVREYFVNWFVRKNGMNCLEQSRKTDSDCEIIDGVEYCSVSSE